MTPDRGPHRLVLLGHPVAHSLSPTFQNAALACAGIAARYEALDVAPSDLASVLHALMAEGAAGNVTVPHKRAVFESCARRTPIADRVGAVNTFWVEDGQLVGDNTDVGGFDHAVEQLLAQDPTPARTQGHGSTGARARRVTILGAGGSAAAVLAAIAAWPHAQATVWARTPARGEELARRFGAVARISQSVDAALADADLVVNTTPIGLDGTSQPVDVGRLPEGADVLDLVYRPGETAWVRAARARGHRAADGLTMLVEQGALAFERWFGRPPDRAAMWTAVHTHRNRDA